MKRARWRKEPNETGLRSIGQRPRGFELRLDGEVLMYVSAIGGGWASPLTGWYWYGNGKHSLRDDKQSFATAEEAKEHADAYYKANREQFERGRES